jgi:tyrosine-protein kinase Etk/Wzc
MEQPPYSGNYNLPDDDNMDVKRYISMFISNWYWFAFTLFIALSIAYIRNKYSDKIYTVSSTLLIKDDQMGGVNANVESVIPGGDIFKSRQNLKNEMGILKSFRLNDSVMKKLEEFHIVYVSLGRRGIVESRMYKTSPFKVIYDSLENGQPGDKVGISILSDSTYKIEFKDGLSFDSLMTLGARFRKFGFDFKIVPRTPGITIFNKSGSNRYYFYFVNPEGLANEYQNKLSVTPIEKEASLVTLSVSGLVWEQEADYLNMLMEVYKKYGLDNKNETASKTIEFIDDQVDTIRRSLIIAENNLEAFRKSHNFLDLSREGTLIQNRLEKFENEKMAFELQLQYYNYLFEYLNKNRGGEIISPSVMGLTDPILLRLVNELSDMQKEREKLGLNLDGNQPALELMDKQAEGVRESLKENVRNGIAGLKLSINGSNDKISDVEKEISRLPSTERELITIQRKFDLNNTVYTYLLEKRAESGIAKASNVSDNRIIDEASQYSTSQIRPRTRYNLMLALIIGLLFPMVGLYLIDYFNDKIIDKRDIEKKTTVPVIGSISHSVPGSGIPVIEKPGSSLAESFRSVRTSIKYYIKENEKAVITVSSTISSEGKTFISVNLAAITAMLGKKVLLVGLDLRRPSINKFFKFDDNQGMSTYLSSNCKYEEIIKQTQIKNLYYTPSGPVPPNPAELIETDLMREFLEKAKSEFDYIIIDTPPVAIVTDALLLAPYVGLNLFIVRQRFSSRSTLELIEQLHRQGKLKNMAIIINDINLSGYYGYGMRYGYSMGYGYSYGYNYYGKGYSGRYGYSDKSKGYYTEE